jgi:hypothetical protein
MRPMDSIETQVKKVLADHGIRDLDWYLMPDLSMIRIRYQHSKFLWVLDIVIRAYRERLEAEKPHWEPNLVEPQTRALLEYYLHPFILMMLCEADHADADEWVNRFRGVDVNELREKCMRHAANEFEVRLKGYKID